MRKLELNEAIHIVYMTLENGGYSHTEYADGYMVSLYGTERKVKTRDNSIDDIVNEVVDFYNYYGTVNTWFNDDDTHGYGTIYLDVSVNIKDLSEALEFAKDNRQLAIYDCGTGNVIEVA